jgi:hypothetical protein
MDRNLYERANDCRWWALTSAFRRNLAKTDISELDKHHLSAILGYINNLYTVYTNLYLYDLHGEIIAVSNLQETRIVGSKVEDSTGFRDALRDANSQSYSVSNFVSTPLYSDRPTYIYNAAITDLKETNKVIGGIGIVFDSEPQFSAMLIEILPKNADGSPIKNCFAAFTDRKGIILNSVNNEKHAIGEKLPIDEAYLKLSNGQTSSTLIKYSGGNYVLGVAVSKGYREYKTQDNYKNDVIAFVFIPI